MDGGARTIVCAFAVGAALASAPAFAGSESETLTLDLEGHITPICSIVAPSEHHLGDLSRAGQSAIPISLNCNQRLAYEMHSLEGAMRHERASTFSANYTARLELMGDAPSIGRTVASEDMRDTPAADAVDVVPFDEPAQIVIRWDAPPQMLAAGRYRDVLTITLVLDGP